jgi:hypothetical protein
MKDRDDAPRADDAAAHEPDGEPAGPTDEPDIADEHSSVTVADDPIDEPAESDARSA